MRTKISVALFLLTLTFIGLVRVGLAHNDEAGTVWGAKWTYPMSRCYRWSGTYTGGHPEQDQLEARMQAAIGRWNVVPAKIWITWNGTGSCSTGEVFHVFGNSSSPYASTRNQNWLGTCWDCVPSENLITVYGNQFSTLPSEEHKIGALAHEIGHSWDLEHVCDTSETSPCTSTDRDHLMYPYGNTVTVFTPQDHDKQPIIALYPL